MTWNPFDWTAGPFLTLYVCLAIIIFLVGFNLKSTIGPVARVAHQLSVLELAYLAGGARRLGDAALLCLISGSGATIEPKGGKIAVTNQTPLTALTGQPPLMLINSDMTRQQFQTAVEPIVQRTEGRLQEFGYYPTDDQMKSFRMNVLPFVVLLLVFGTIKVIVGSERHHPVGFLVVLLFFTGLGAILLAKRPMRTRAGNEVLETYQASHARASRAPREHELLLAVALSGAVVLTGTAYASVYTASKSMGGGGDGGGGGGCGGGGGGCGGCS